jgi:hypothetical protein
VRLGSRAASKVVGSKVVRAASKVGNRASPSNSVGRRAKVAPSSSKDSKVAPGRGKAVLARVAKVRAAKVVKAAKVNKASRSSLASRVLVARSSSKVEPDRAEPDRVALDKVAKVEWVRVDLVAKANPSSSAGRGATHKSNRVDSKADLDRPAKVVQGLVARGSPTSLASKVPVARRDNRVFPDNKAFRSKAAQDRKACPASRAGPINSATEAPPLVRKARASPVRKAPEPRAHKALSASIRCARNGKGALTKAATPSSRKATA